MLRAGHLDLVDRPPGPLLHLPQHRVRVVQADAVRTHRAHRTIGTQQGAHRTVVQLAPQVPQSHIDRVQDDRMHDQPCPQLWPQLDRRGAASVPARSVCSPGGHLGRPERGDDMPRRRHAHRHERARGQRQMRGRSIPACQWTPVGRQPALFLVVRAYRLLCAIRRLRQARSAGIARAIPGAP